MQHNIDTNMILNLDIHSKQGWKTEETDLLWHEVKKANEEKRSLKSAFDTVAAITRRKPNSIRNYYYMKIKDEQVAVEKKPSPFVPFAQDEIIHLLKTVLKAQAKGQSVRSSTLEMGNGDRKNMLRYQNKYRSVIKNNRPFVEKIMQELGDSNEKYINPYLRIKNKSISSESKTSDLVDTLSILIENIINTGVDVEAFLSGLNNLASLAAANKNINAQYGFADIKVKELKREIEEAMEENRRLYLENDALINKVRTLVAQNEIEKEKSSRAVSMFRELLRVNKEFLGLNPVTKVSGLSGYIQELNIRMQEYETLVNEH